MMTAVRRTCLLVLAFAASALWIGDEGRVLAADEKAGPWGTFVDPDGDSTFRTEGGALTISVNGTPHDLSAELGRMNAPRALRTVSGDFIIEVKASGGSKPDGMAIPERFPYQGTGLLLMHDDGTYVRLERAAVAQPGELIRYVNLELRQDGRRVPPAQTARLRDDVPLRLRLERRGDVILGAIRTDGSGWTYLEPITLKLPDEVKVGVAAVNATDRPLEAKFEEFGLFVPAPDVAAP